MADREKVLDGLKACADHTGALCRTCPYDYRKESCISDMAEDALELLKEQPEQKFFVASDGKITPLPIQQEWISVKDKLPDDASDVLAYYDCGDSGHVIFVNYYKNCWYDVFNDLIDDLEQGYITHWMPLPEPPEVN